jgi:hypothetical protein
MSEHLRNSLKDLRQRFPNQHLEDVYLRHRSEYYKRLPESLPELCKIVFGRRYLLPHNRQTDYHSATACDYMLLDNLLRYLQGFEVMQDHVAGHCLANFVQSLHYNKPTFYLEREFGEPLLRTPLPLDYVTSDINWRWPSFRVYLPKGLLTLTRDGKTDHAMFLDICYFSNGEPVEIPKRLYPEINATFGPTRFPMLLRVSPFDGMSISCFFDFEGSDGAVAFACTTGLGQETIRDIITESRTNMTHTEPLDDIDHEYNNRMFRLAVNLLLRLSTIPDECPSNQPEPVIRKPRMEGKHMVPGLYPAKFIGSTLIRHTPPAPHKPGEPTGRHLEPHWRAGHWKRQVHGPRNTLRKLIWIGIYHVGDES